MASRPVAGMPGIRGWPVRNRVGESPAWHAAHGCLYWIDVRAAELLRLDPAAGRLLRRGLPDIVGAMALCDDGRSAWLAFSHTLSQIDLESGFIRDVAAVEADRPHNRLNDGKLSPGGRWFVFGSMDDRPEKSATGALYCVDAAGRVRRLSDGLVVANGIAFSPDGGTLVFSDSARATVWRAPWDEERGAMGDPVPWLQLDDARGRPDGAWIDAAGIYWSAGVSAGCVNGYEPDGTLRSRIALPCRAPTMPALGGLGHDKVFVTSLVRPAWTEVMEWDGALLEMDASLFQPADR